MNNIDYEIYNLGNVELLSGEILLSAKLAYKTYGSLNSDKSNVIILPTFYTGTHNRNEGFFGTNRAINPEKHFIISINLFGNGLSTSPTNAEKDILSSIPYQKNKVLLHTDSSVLPKRKLAWASWNYQLDSDPGLPVVLTYNMNILQSINCKETLCVTLNDHNSVDETKILKKITYHHPLFNGKSIEAQKRKSEISGVNNTHYCGAYWRNGFHEDGVVSALDVCKDFGEQI